MVELVLRRRLLAACLGGALPLRLGRSVWRRRVGRDGVTVIDLPVHELTAAAFAPYGQVIAASDDGVPFGPHEAQLDFDGGVPRFYIFSLQAKPLAFRHITRHQRVTQCLAAVGGGSWLVAVAPPSGSVPDPERIMAFRVPGSVAVKLHRGTWHAGPYFVGATMSFFNLELADTNQADHDSCMLDAVFGRSYRFAAA